jgi:hypothetical protein
VALTDPGGATLAHAVASLSREYTTDIAEGPAFTTPSMAAIFGPCAERLPIRGLTRGAVKG